CTCLAVSRRWLALGSSGGGLNLIQRDGWKHRLILTHKVNQSEYTEPCLVIVKTSEKFWKIGNKERDGEYGACFFLGGRNSGGQQPLIYCARPGSRMWEVNIEGEVQSTHQFKQLLSSPPLPIISTRFDPQYDPTLGPPQSLAFGKLLFFGEHSVVTWTDRGIYVFLPQNVQVLLWSQVKGIQDMCVYKTELLCLHVDGKISHFSLLPVDRCVERLIKRSSWGLAARVCHLFQNAVISSKARKVLPMDKLEHVKSQLDLVLQADLVKQMEEVLSRIEPMDSACSSRRSSISSHESFNVLDCGIYRVVSRRNSQSDEDSGSLHSQTLSEDERLRELSAPLEDEHVESVSQKTTEKIGNLHMSPEIRRKQEAKEEEHPHEVPMDGLAQQEEEKTEIEPPQPPTPSVEEILLGELKLATLEAMHKLQDSQVLFNVEEMGKVLKDWLMNLEKALSPQDLSGSCETSLNSSGEADSATTDSSDIEEIERKPSVCSRVEEDFVFRVRAPCFIEEPLHRDLSQLAIMCLEYNVFASEACLDGNPSACRFIRKYLFLLDLKRLKRCLALIYSDVPSLWDTYIEGLKDLAGPGPLVLAIEKEDLVSAVQRLKDMEPWDSPLLLAYVSRIYDKFGESAVRSLPKFYPSILPVDVKHLCRANPGHFLAYLDNLIKTKPEQQRLFLLQSLAQPESLKLDWLQLAVSHDAPHSSSTVDSTGNPRPRSHLFTWGYGHLMSLLIELPSDFVTKEKMLNICRTAGYWQGFITLCLQLDRRLEALTSIVYLDDMSLIDENNGLLPETMDEWKSILHLAQTCGAHRQGVTNGDALTNGHSDWTSCITVENVALLLAKVIGPDKTLPYLEEWGLTENVSERYSQICEVMKVAEKRQRALIQSMLERCDRFLWSQQA
ncbi:hypothetical protein AB205_0076780, partial [Aquarana catesbeiana]